MGFQNYDPFDVRPADDLVEAAKARAAAAMAAEEIQDDLSFFGAKAEETKASDVSSPTQEGGSPASSRPPGFEDEFHVDVSLRTCRGVAFQYPFDVLNSCVNYLPLFRPTH